jgi:hypothetical protein
MRFFCFLTGLALLLLARLGHSQQLPDSTTRIVALPDVKIESSSSRLVAVSGLEDNNTNHLIAPGGGYAVRFLAPRAQYHELRQVRLHLQHANKLREGQIKVRVALVTANGSPGEDDLLLAPVILTTADLLRARKHLTLGWPTVQLLVPERGFFIMVESLGQSGDEYVSQQLPREKNNETTRYEIRRRSQAEAPGRIADALGFPRLKGTKPDPQAAESWHKDTVTREWRRSRPGRSVILIEAVFE